MLINNLEDAEAIVNAHPWLEWDGWVILHKSQDDYAEYLVTGMFDKETRQWYKVDRYYPSEQGWDLPDRIIPRWKK